MTTRRQAIIGLASLLAACRASGRVKLGDTEAFSWTALQDRALALSREPWKAPPPPPAILPDINYDAVAQIEYRPERTLWGDRGDATGVRFFPLTKMARRGVDISVVENGRARPFPYSAALYKFPSDHPMAKLGKAGGFTGFRVMNKGGIGDWLAFQGASYFRTAGPLHQYGLSARGLAINTGINGPEEFPDFTHFWLEHSGDGEITVYALLDGPSVTGAYRLVNRLGTDEITQDVSMVIHMRKSVERLGIAPLTSMFWYGEGNRAQARDWRPEIHDSDGLAIHTGSGERIWRPLNNPPHPQTNMFSDTGPRGYGLLQRDRNFDHYQDDAVFHEKRPNLWVEPKGDWGPGSVTLYEIPTVWEYDDNIVAFWTPQASPAAGARLNYDYRLRWIGKEPEDLPSGHVVNCWTGQGSVPGEPVREGITKLVADFQGDRFAGLTYQSPVKPIIDVANGKLVNSGCYPVNGQKNCWRLIADIERNGVGPVDIRAFLRLENDAITETLLYQLF